MRAFLPWLGALLILFSAGSTAATAAEAEAGAPPASSQAGELSAPASTDVAPEILAADVIPLTHGELAELADTFFDAARARTAELVEEHKFNPAAHSGGLDEAGKARLQARHEQALLDMLEARAKAFERLEIVLSEWEDKGGDPAEIDKYRAYRRAVMADTIEEASVLGLAKVIWFWLSSPEGGLQILGAFAIFLLAFAALLVFAALVRGLARHHLSRSKKASKLLQAFLVFLIYWLVILLGIGVIFSALGLDITPFLAVFGGISFIVAFALQETLGNFAAGLMILIYRPFDMHERVIAAGVDGFVHNLRLTSTIIITPDHQLITIPNSKVWNDVIVNASDLPTRRVDMQFLIASPTDALALMTELRPLLAAHPDVLAEPPPGLHIGAYDGRGATLQVRPWVSSASYWAARRSLTKLVMEHMTERGIELWEPREWEQSPV